MEKSTGGWYGCAGQSANRGSEPYRGGIHVCSCGPATYRDTARLGRCRATLPGSAEGPAGAGSLVGAPVGHGGVRSAERGAIVDVVPRVGIAAPVAVGLGVGP